MWGRAQFSLLVPPVPLALLGWRVQTVDSAGTSSEHEGDAPDSRSIAEAARRGLDISTHRAQQLRASHWESFDVILSMDSSNYRNVQRSKPKGAYSAAGAGSKLAKLLMYLPSGDVPDPWYGDDSGFSDCYELLNKHTDHVFATVLKAVESEGAKK